MYAQVDHGTFADLDDLFFYLFLGFGNHFFYTRRVDTAVGNQTVHGQAGYLAPNRVEAGKDDRFRCIVNNDLDTGGCFQRADVAAFATDDTSLDLIVLDIEDRYRVLNSALRSGTLDGLDNDLFGLLGGGQLGFVHNVLDLHHGLGARFFAQVIHQLVPGFFSRYAGNSFQLLYVLLLQVLNFFLLFGRNFYLLLQVTLGIVQVGFLPVQVFQTLVHRLLLLYDFVLALVDGVVFAIDLLLMLCLHLQKFLFCFQQLVFTNYLGIIFSILLYL